MERKRTSRFLFFTAALGGAALLFVSSCFAQETENPAPRIEVKLEGGEVTSVPPPPPSFDVEGNVKEAMKQKEEYEETERLRQIQEYGRDLSSTSPPADAPVPKILLNLEESIKPSSKPEHPLEKILKKEGELKKAGDEKKKTEEKIPDLTFEDALKNATERELPPQDPFPSPDEGMPLFGVTKDETPSEPAAPKTEESKMLSKGPAVSPEIRMPIELPLANEEDFTAPFNNPIHTLGLSPQTAETSILFQPLTPSSSASQSKAAQDLIKAEMAKREQQEQEENPSIVRKPEEEAPQEKSFLFDILDSLQTASAPQTGGNEASPLPQIAGGEGASPSTARPSPGSATDSRRGSSLLGVVSGRVAGFDVAGIRLGMRPSRALQVATRRGFEIVHVKREIPEFLKIAYGMACKRRGMYVYDYVQGCVREQAQEQGKEYVSFAKLEKKSTKEELTLTFSSTYGGNVLFRLDYTTFGDNSLGTSDASEHLKTKRRVDFWRAVRRKYGDPDDARQMIWGEPGSDLSLKASISSGASIDGHLELENQGIEVRDLLNIKRADLQTPGFNVFTF